MKITIDREVLEQVLEVLKSTGLFLHHCWCDVQMNEHSFDLLNKQMNHADTQIKHLRETLAQPQQGSVEIEAVYETIINWDEGGGKRSRRELSRRIAALYAATPSREPLTHGDLDLFRQWFGCIQDTSPSYIGRNDCALAAKLYTRLGLPIPKELQGVSARGIKETK